MSKSLGKLPVLAALTAAALLAACVNTPDSSDVLQPISDDSVEAASGIDKSALVRVMGMHDLDEMLYGVFYIANKVNRPQLDAAPARICAHRNLRLISAEDKPLEHPGTMPGVRKLMVRCK